MDKLTNILPEDIARIKDMKIRIEILQTRSEKAAAEARLAAVELQSYTQHLFLSYGLSLEDRIEDGTGLITRAADQQEQEQPEQPESSTDDS